MERDFWLNKWDDNQIGFHQSEYNPHLIDYFPSYLNKIVKKPKVFVPLCGKTKDIIYLAQNSEKVIGVELAEKACIDFFIENSLQFQCEEISSDLKVFKGLNIELYCGDIFELNDNYFKDCDLIYDRASLVALPTDLRNKLYQLYKNMVLNGSTLFAILFEYDQSKMDGPPFAILPTEIKDRFKEFQIKQINSIETNFGENKIKFIHHTYEVRK